MKYKDLLPFISIILLGFIPLLDLFSSGFPVTHDGQDHIARIANFYKNLEEGVLIPRWAANLNWGYGHPILMFLYPLPSYLASFFHFLGISFIDSVKLVFGFAFVASGITMYLWIRNFLGTVPAIFASVLYLLAPYRFVDLYVRGAIGEHVAFVFPPLVLYFLLKLSKKYSPLYVIGGSLSLSGFILSHNAISLMFLPIILFYAFYLIWQSKFKKYLILNTLYLMLLGFGVSAFFWVPAFFEGKYTLRNIVTQGSYLKHFVDPKMFLYSPWNYGQSGQFTLQIGFVNIVSLLVSFFTSLYLFKKKSKLFFFILALLIYTMFSLFIMTSYSSFIWQEIILLQNFQFPWRFLSVVVFTTSVLGAFFINLLPGKLKTLTVIGIIFVVLFITKDYWHAKSYLSKSESFFTSVYSGTTDTGESSPKWSVRFMEQEPKAHLEVIGGNAIIEELGRKSDFREYRVNVKKDAQFRENTLYFPGWNVYINGKLVDIEFQDSNNRGVITFNINQGENDVRILFQNTKLRTISNILTIFSFSILFIFFGRVELIKIFKR